MRCVEEQKMSCYKHFEFYVTILVVLISYKTMVWQASATPTTLGFVSLPLNQSNIELQRPYDVPLDQRYSFTDGVHKLWVYKNDKPHATWSKTKPRTEIRIQGYDYSSGVWQFEGNGFVPSGTSGVSVMQVKGSRPPHSTTLMIHVYNGSLYHYRDVLLVHDIYDKWFRVNVIHNVEGNSVKAYINGVLKYEGSGRGGKSHYFKCGVYAQDEPSSCMESRWKDIKIFKKC